MYDISVHITWLSHLPLTGIEAGLLTTTMSSSICTRVIGWLVTGTSCLQRYTRQAYGNGLGAKPHIRRRKFRLRRRYFRFCEEEKYNILVFGEEVFSVYCFKNIL